MAAKKKKEPYSFLLLSGFEGKRSFYRSSSAERPLRQKKERKGERHFKTAVNDAVSHICFSYLFFPSLLLRRPAGSSPTVAASLPSSTLAHSTTTATTSSSSDTTSAAAATSRAATTSWEEDSWNSSSSSNSNISSAAPTQGFRWRSSERGKKSTFDQKVHFFITCQIACRTAGTSLGRSLSSSTAGKPPLPSHYAPRVLLNNSLDGDEEDFVASR